MPDNQAREKKCLHQSKFYYSCALCREKLETQISDQRLVIKAAEKLAILAQDLTKKILFGRGANVFWASREILSSIKALKEKYGA